MIFEYSDGIYHFMLPERELELKPFLSQYERVREQDGNGAHTVEYYRMLPVVSEDHQDVERWRIRGRSFENLLGLLPSHQLKILDLGAGNCWLTHQLTARGHPCVAIDISTNCDDGLGAQRHYPTHFMCAQADFDALPFVPGQFEVAIFNASLHYSPNVKNTLRHVRSFLKQNGMIFVIDSPTFRDSPAGQKMVANRDEQFIREFGFDKVFQYGSGYLTRRQMKSAGFRFHTSNPGFRWAVRRVWSWIKLRREPAAFGVWEGTSH